MSEQQGTWIEDRGEWVALVRHGDHLSVGAAFAAHPECTYCSNRDGFAAAANDLRASRTATRHYASLGVED